MRIEAEFQVFEGADVYDSREKGPIRGEIEHIIRALRGRRVSQLGFAVLQVSSRKDCRRLIDMLLQLEHCFKEDNIPDANLVDGDAALLEWKREIQEHNEKNKLLRK